MNRFRSFRHLILILCMLSFATLPAYTTTVQEEIDLGIKIDAEIIKKIPLSSDQAAQKEMNEFGKKLAKNVKRTEIPYHFKLMDEGNDLDAFSIPGGYVYFSQRMWDTLRKDERTGVLAHEIAHVDQRHAIDAMSKAKTRSFGLAVLLTIIRANSSWANIADITNSIFNLKYSRGDEQQADEIAVDLSNKSGMNPAGILLAMRKIQRTQDERGGQPPKILSTHPPTKERVQYLTKMLNNMNVPIPPENIVNDPISYQIGKITKVNSESIEFTSTQSLQAGSVVWLMAPGWDFYYEKKTMEPVARGIVKSGNGTYVADIWKLSTVKKDDIVNGAGVFAPPAPPQEKSIGTITSPSMGLDTPGRITSSTKLNKLDRLLAMEVVWDEQANKLINDSVGYVVITDPASPTGHVTLPRPRYSYAPVYAGALLVKLIDPDDNRWVGPIVSIGRNGQTIEVITNETLDANKTYDVLYPAWNTKDTYMDRTAGQARFHSANGKIVLRMTTFKPGWDMNSIQNGFEVYEALEKTD